MKTSISLETKKSIIRDRERGDTVKSIAFRYSILPCTVCLILRSRKQIMSRSFAKGTVRMGGYGRKETNERMEILLESWICKRREMEVSVSHTDVKAKAKQLWEECRVEDDRNFLASDGWYRRFLTRTGIKIERTAKERKQSFLVDSCENGSGRGEMVQEEVLKKKNSLKKRVKLRNVKRKQSEDSDYEGITQLLERNGDEGWGSRLRKNRRNKLTEACKASEGIEGSEDENGDEMDENLNDVVVVDTTDGSNVDITDGTHVDITNEVNGTHGADVLEEDDVEESTGKDKNVMEDLADDEEGSERLGVEKMMGGRFECAPSDDSIRVVSGRWRVNVEEEDSKENIVTEVENESVLSKEVEKLPLDVVRFLVRNSEESMRLCMKYHPNPVQAREAVKHYDQVMLSAFRQMLED